MDQIRLEWREGNAEPLVLLTRERCKVNTYENILPCISKILAPNAPKNAKEMKGVTGKKAITTENFNLSGNFSANIVPVEPSSHFSLIYH
jgi:hypothetical protein